jgi:hypothetical protein
VRLSFPDLFDAVEFKTGDGKPRWNASFLIEPGSVNDKAIREAIAAEAKATWGVNAAKNLKACEGQGNKYAYIDGDTKTYDGYASVWCLAAHRPAIVKGRKNTPPLVLDNNKAPITEDSGRVYAGCYVNAKVSIYCQSGENPGVRASFSAVQFWRDGDAFSANTPSGDGFESAAAGIDADDFS